jgi:hypothetical protein
MLLFGMTRCVQAFSATRRVQPLWRLYATGAPSAEERERMLYFCLEKPRVLFLGTPDVAATSLRTIFEHSMNKGSSSSKYQVVGVVTQPPKRRKRKGKEIPSSVGLVAEELGIPVLCPEKVRLGCCFAKMNRSSVASHHTQCFCTCRLEIQISWKTWKKMFVLICA